MKFKFALFLLVVLCTQTNQSKLRKGKQLSKKPAENIKDLYSKIHRRDVRNVTTVAMLMGTISTGQKLKENLEKMMSDVKTNLDTTPLSENKQKIKKIEYTMNRDRKAFEILYKVIMTGITKNDTNITVTAENTSIKTNNGTNLYDVQDSFELREYLSDLEKNVKTHLDQMKQSTEKMSDFVMKFFENVIKRDEEKKKDEKIEDKTLKKSNKDTKIDQKPSILATNQIDTSTFFMNPAMYPLMYNPYNNWPFIAANLKLAEDNKRRQDLKGNELSDEENDSKESTSKEKESQVTVESQEDESEESSEESAPGGLAGLIASLSGGDMGSDVGALLGAVSGVVTNIFGPDGLDIESLISTGTGLIGGLLGGEENVGKVFSNYLGAALEGFSGGGGADNNGLFIGNFLGGTLAKLSADPEDEEAPIRPDIFFSNFAKGLNEGLGKAGDDRDGSDSHHSHGSDSFSFIGKVISSAVAGVVNLVVQAILGSIGGSSEGSAGLSGTSSDISKGSSSSSNHHHHDPGWKPPAEGANSYY
ncbi:uncharacterized protein LOC134835539 [Culicoides brevitarsis]|uniref:uncharacterized protein LOC134835539 n=1 Tax=Culicoides brevitarsis TaxID=469753 RepID=UPI00307C2984